jgi:hypothetical protein
VGDLSPITYLSIPLLTLFLRLPRRAVGVSGLAFGFEFVPQAFLPAPPSFLIRVIRVDLSAVADSRPNGF